MKEYEFPSPDDKSGRSMFPLSLEIDPQIFFHCTKRKNMESIQNEGFLPRKKLPTVSYAKKSINCWPIREEKQGEDCVVFVVKFLSLQSDDIMENLDEDIHVYNEIQPDEIIGFCLIPKEYVQR